MKKFFHRSFSMLTACIMLISSFGFYAGSAHDGSAADKAAHDTAFNTAVDTTFNTAVEAAAFEKDAENSAVNAPERAPSDNVTIIVKLEDAPVLALSGERERQADERARLLKKQDAVISEIGNELLRGEAPEVLYRYTELFNGFSFRGEYRLIERIKTLSGVKNCYESWKYALPELPKAEGEQEKLSSSVGFINADDMWALGYSGQGRTVAVIDTGIRADHPNFAAAPENPHFTVSSLQSVLDTEELCAEQRYTQGTLGAADLYLSAKIPFTFNYLTGRTDASHSTAQNDHGTHVSSIAAGNDDNARGVAYNAQIIAMQVFGSMDADWADIIAALEDCAHLRVDALNMSLGADCGFTHDEDMRSVFELLTASGVNCAVASGNSGTTGSGNIFNGTTPTFNMDNGTTNTPGTLPASMSVAASYTEQGGAPASYSSWGTTSDLRIKPEIMAPGDMITGLYAKVGGGAPA